MSNPGVSPACTCTGTGDGRQEETKAASQVHRLQNILFCQKGSISDYLERVAFPVILCSRVIINFLT